jgi:hypothetical protein
LPLQSWPWWNQQLNMGIKPDFVIVEKGAKPSGVLSGYQPANIGNSRFEVWVAPGIAPPANFEHTDLGIPPNH